MDSEKLEVVHQIVGALPSEWNLYRIKQIVSVKITDGPHETPPLEEDGIPFISAEAIKEEKIDFKKRRGYITKELHEVYSRKCKPQKDDIFIVKSGATTGNVAYVDTGMDFNIWSPLAVVRCDPEIAYFKFVFYQLLSDVFRKQVELNWSFGTQENIGMGVLGRIKVTVPPISEQTRIAQYLDQTCAAIDRAITVKQQQLEKLDQLRKSIIYKAVTKGLDDSVEMRDSGLDWCTSIPVHWDVSKLKRVFSEVDYGISESTSEDGFYAVLKMGNIVDREIAFTKIEYVSDVAPSLVLEKHDLLFNRTNSHDQVAKVGIFRGKKEENVTFASYLVRLRAGSRHDAEFLNYLLNTDEFLGLARKLAIPSVQQANLNPTRYGRMEVCVPPYNEQSDIRRFLDTKLANIRNAEDKTRKQIDVLRDYKKSLIHECVTGKRRITQADLKEVA